MKVRGRIAQETVAAGSKSEHTAIVLNTEAGATFILRRQGGPAFGDWVLPELVGLDVEVVGVAQGSTLIVTHWEIL